MTPHLIVLDWGSNNNLLIIQAYVTQENMLMTTLTVREVIYYSAQIQLPDTMTVAEKVARADDTIQEMGLTSALDTRIGGRTTKGISGGQRKRLSICLEIITRPRLLFLDEPTSGLDSAASFHVMSRIALLAAKEGITVVAVVHQPCSEVFDLFHGLCLLASGKTIFFGPAASAAEVILLAIFGYSFFSYADIWVKFISFLQILL
jgi:ABC-type multidrug transport system ATPase subunit